MRTIKIVSWRPTGEPVPITTITMDDNGKVHIEPNQDLEKIGPFGKVLTPADGKEYFEGLRYEFRNPYAMAVEYNSEGKIIIFKD